MKKYRVLANVGKMTYVFYVYALNIQRAAAQAIMWDSCTVRRYDRA